MLWKYNGTGDMAAPSAPRTKVGGGWDAYTAITPLGSLSAGGYGDLVARDTAGVLWYYQATYDDAKPFKPRVRVGSGWNTYTALAGGGLSHTMGLPALVARDADGKIWYYEPTGDITHPFAPASRPATAGTSTARWCSTRTAWSAVTPPVGSGPTT